MDKGSSSILSSHAMLSANARVLAKFVESKDQKTLMNTYKQCFTGRSAIEVILSRKQTFNCEDKESALRLCQQLLDERYVIRAQASDVKGLASLASTKDEVKEIFSDSKDSHYQFTTLKDRDDHHDNIVKLDIGGRRNSGLLTAPHSIQRQDSKRRGSINSLNQMPSQRSMTPSRLSRIGSINNMSMRSPSSSNLTSSNSSSNLFAPPPLISQSSTQNFLAGRAMADNNSRDRQMYANAVQSHKSLMQQTVKEANKKGDRGRSSSRLQTSDSARDLSLRGAPSVSYNVEPNNERGRGKKRESSVSRLNVLSREIIRDYSTGGVDERSLTRQNSDDDDSCSESGSESGISMLEPLTMDPQEPLNPQKFYSYYNFAGYLEKKQRKNFAMPMYQRRYFRLEVSSRVLAYYKSQSHTFPYGFIDLADISKVCLRPEKMDGKRLDIITPNRTYALRADNEVHATDWVTNIQNAIDDLRDGKGPFQRKPFLHNETNVNIANDLALYVENKPLHHSKRRQTQLNTSFRRPSTSSINPNLPTPVVNDDEMVVAETTSMVTILTQKNHLLVQRPVGFLNGALRLTPLRSGFYQINHSVSLIGQKDHFLDVLSEYPDDESVLACVAKSLQDDAPDQNSTTLQRHDSDDDGYDTGDLSFSRSSTPSDFPSVMIAGAPFSFDLTPEQVDLDGDKDKSGEYSIDSTIPPLKPMLRRTLSSSCYETMNLDYYEDTPNVSTRIMFPSANPGALVSLGLIGQMSVYDNCDWIGSTVGTNRHLNQEDDDDGILPPPLRRSLSDIGLESTHFVKGKVSVAPLVPIIGDCALVHPNGEVEIRDVPIPNVGSNTNANTKPNSAYSHYSRENSVNSSYFRNQSSQYNNSSQSLLAVPGSLAGAVHIDEALEAEDTLNRYITPSRYMRMQRQRSLLLHLSASPVANNLGSLSVQSRVSHWIRDPAFLPFLVDKQVLSSELRMALPVAWGVIMLQHHLHNDYDDDDCDDDDNSNEFSVSRNISRIHSIAPTPPNPNISSSLLTIPNPNADFPSRRGSIHRHMIQPPMHSNNSSARNETIMTLVQTLHDSSAPPESFMQELSLNPKFNSSTSPVPPYSDSRTKLVRIHKDSLFSSSTPTVIATELVAWLIWRGYVNTINSALELAKALFKWGVIMREGRSRFGKKITFNYDKKKYVVRSMSGLSEILSVLPVPPVQAVDGNSLTISSSLFSQKGNSLLHSRQSVIVPVIDAAQQKLNTSWLGTMAISTLLTGLSVNHWQRVWVPTCKSCQRAAQTFSTLVAMHCSPMQFTIFMADQFDLGESEDYDLTPIREMCIQHALLATLTTPVFNIKSVPRVNIMSPQFSQTVYNAGVWRSLFGCAYVSQYDVRRTILTQINTLLHFCPNKSANVMSLITQPGWSDWVLALLDDVTDEMIYFNNLPYDFLYTRVMEGGRVDDQPVITSLLNEDQQLIATVYQLTMHIVVLGLMESFVLDNTSIVPSSSDKDDNNNPMPSGVLPMTTTSIIELATLNVNARDCTYDFNPLLQINNYAICDQWISYAKYAEYQEELLQQKTPGAHIANLSPFYANAFLVSLSHLGKLSGERPLCFRSQLRDAVLIGLSRSTPTNYTLPRAILSSCVNKIHRLNVGSSGVRVPLHHRLDQVAYLLAMVKSFVFSVSLRVDDIEDEYYMDEKKKKNQKKVQKKDEDDMFGFLGIPGYTFVLGSYTPLTAGELAVDLATLNSLNSGDMSVSQIVSNLEKASEEAGRVDTKGKRMDEWVKDGGTLHWKERHGIDSDIELVEKTISMLQNLKFIDVSTPAAQAIFTISNNAMNSNILNKDTMSFGSPSASATSGSIFNKKQQYGTIRIGAGGVTAQHFARHTASPNVQTPQSAFTNGVNAGCIFKPAPEEVYAMLTSHVQFSAEDKKPNSKSIRTIKYIQNMAEFLKDSLDFLALMRERLCLLTAPQIAALVRYYVKIENRQKIFTSKLQI